MGTLRGAPGSHVPDRCRSDSMIPDDPYLLVRAGSLYVTVVLTVAIWIVRRPTARDVSAGLLASVLNLPALMALNLAAMRYGWGTFDGRRGTVLGATVDFPAR